MVVDEQWTWQDIHNIEEEKKVEAGYEHMKSDLFVYEEDAYDYAIEQCLHGTEEMQQEFREMPVDWFYSGNWIKRG
jgi:hypothetical protein